MIIRRTHLLQIAATVTVALLLGACSDKEEPAAEDNSPEQGAACQLLDSEKISTATGEQVELVADLSADSQCAYQAGGGPVGVTVTLMDAATPAQFAALVTTDSQAEVPSAPVEGADEALIWRESPQIQAGVARVGGSAVKVTWVQSSPTDDDAAMIAMLGAAAKGLPGGEFTDSAAPGQETCDRVPVESLREALALPELTASPAGVATACALADGSGVNLTVELPEGEATPEQVTASGRTTTIDGKDYEWVPEPISGLGGAAIWTLDPVSGRTGELVAVFDGQLVRVSSSANDPGDEIKERAITTARVVGGGDQ